MQGLEFINFNDMNNRWELDKVLDICKKISDYAAARGLQHVELKTVEDSTWSDTKNQRYDIEIRYVGNEGTLIQQKLLILKGELLDGDEFHKRVKEFYP